MLALLLCYQELDIEIRNIKYTYVTIVTPPTKFTNTTQLAIGSLYLQNTKFHNSSSCNFSIGWKSYTHKRWPIGRRGEYHHFRRWLYV